MSGDLAPGSYDVILATPDLEKVLKPAAKVLRAMLPTTKRGMRGDGGATDQLAVRYGSYYAPGHGADCVFSAGDVLRRDNGGGCGGCRHAIQEQCAVQDGRIWPLPCGRWQGK